jgi:hypothetical protein
VENKRLSGARNQSLLEEYCLYNDWTSIGLLFKRVKELVLNFLEFLFVVQNLKVWQQGVSYWFPSELKADLGNYVLGFLC